MSTSNGYVSVYNVLKEKYLIPSYQRGYRWSEKNVEKLLNDIFEGRLISDSPEVLEKLKTYNGNQKGFYDKVRTISFKDGEAINKYCIQPLVVYKKPDEKKYEVIDGQQRLTTICIILAALNVYNNEVHDAFDVKTYEEICNIEYESREGSEEFLKQLFKGNTSGENNLDYEYMKVAFEVAKNYFEKITNKENFDDKIGNETEINNYREKYLSYLADVIALNTNFIWYEIDSNADRRKVFADFNSGKIELTNSELIKAQFMNPANYVHKEGLKDKQTVLSEKWDEIENHLRDDYFWAFVPHPEQYKEDKERYFTRIDVLFEFAVFEYDGYKPPEQISSRYTYDSISERIEKAEGPEGREKLITKIWSDVKRIYAGLRELYEDNYTYNMIGLHIDNKNRKEGSVGKYVESCDHLSLYKDIKGILDKPRDQRKEEIRKLIIEDLFKNADSKIKEENVHQKLKSILYTDHKGDISKFLMAYNVAILCHNEIQVDTRFDFRRCVDLIKNGEDSWSLEHVFAQKTDVSVKYETGKHKIRKILELLYDKGEYFEYLYELFRFNKENEEVYVDENNKTILVIGDEKDTLYRINKENPDEEELENICKLNSKEKTDKNYVIRAAKAYFKAKKLLEYYDCIEKADRLLEYSDKLKDEIRQYLTEQINVSDEAQINRFRLDPNEVTDELIEAVKKAQDNAIIEIRFYEHVYKYTVKKEYENTEAGEMINEQSINDLLRKEIVTNWNESYNSHLKSQLESDAEIGSENLLNALINALKLNRKTLIRAIDKFFTKNINKEKEIEDGDKNDRSEFVDLLNDDHISNMALLSKNANSSLNDSKFEEKQTKFFKEISKEISYGAFVPQGTISVFSDVYTNNKNQTGLWMPDTRREYFKHIKELIMKII